MEQAAFFERATGYPPYPYQQALAGGDAGKPCAPYLIDIPTGLGKTAAVVLAWLWNRVVLQRIDWPRRLAYCLPMRTLVEQTENEVKGWIGNLLKNPNGLTEETVADLSWLRDHSPVILMGGEELDSERKEWDLYPEKPAILIGTQDMLLSRALNRGYGMSRYRWPVHFALLNNDCLWVMDETQLMGVGVETSAQLDGFRHDPNMPTAGNCPTWWMSATLFSGRLDTVDHRPPEAGWPWMRLSDKERTDPHGHPYKLFNATKKVFKAPFALTKENKKAYPAKLAQFIKEKHVEGALTLVVVNRVSRAQEIHTALTTVRKGQQPLYDPQRVGLIHSRFRRKDREKGEQLMHGEGDRIIIATQAVEAGVDVSARVLITELAPWASLVQRFGRCNRRAGYTDAWIYWVDIEWEGEKDESARPYQTGELTEARKAMRTLDDASPGKLSQVKVPEREVVRPVVRRRDLVDLFDTTPDICGQDIDISRYIRDGNDTDVQFFWRLVPDDGPSPEERVPAHDELCRVAIGDAVKFFGKKGIRAWRWDHLEKRWAKADKPLPGTAYLLDAKAGGYSGPLGWTGEAKDKPTPLEHAEAPPHEANGDDKGTFNRKWETLTEHTVNVVGMMEAILPAIGVNGQTGTALTNAAWWHDMGKLHEAFKAMMQENGQEKPGGPWAKSPHNTRQKERPGFRHELASALAWLLSAPSDATERDLTAYLIAAHHGKVRLSIRSWPNEKEPADGRLFARGVWDRDPLPAITLGPHTIPAVALDLSFMHMGEGPHGPSWLARVTALRDRFGPFLLAYLETLLRAADARASTNSLKHELQGAS
ncbi:MAG: CRISPR-associated endonuclease Cas3'' [Flavobacteriia bacterium]|nr:CRISPR-associated endonuclease Cas3'' [Flavobacteriia bacterium]